ncbi:MAG: diacylglycerol kinase family protein [Bacteroidia bacterium]|nr:diacylglycerol kinase family protein [Bacteroidia bacterium]HQU99583.1 diacylglycerol kinase family protein [Bacteroidia bacterium]
MTSNKFSLRARINSFFYAGNGIKYLINSEPNFLVHLLASVFVIFMGWYFKISSNQWLALAITMALVLVTETVNTCIELLVDWISPQHQQQAGLIKDIAAAAVLISAIMAMVVAAIIFLPLL